MLRRPVASALAALALFAPLRAGAQQVSDPELYGKSLQAAEQALELYGRWGDEDEAARVLEIGYRLAERSGFRDFPFTFYLIDMPVPNAFALPGGQIFITRGMLDLSLDDDMLAGLLGHEIGHVTQGHGLRMQRRATLLNVLSQALLVGVIVAASDDGGPTSNDPYARSSSSSRIEGVAAAGVVVSELLLRSYSREFEDEADAEGQRVAAGAGFDPGGTRALMTTMEARIPQTKEYGYWRTHPFFDDRVRAATAREKLLTRLETRPVDRYRRDTQRALLAFAETAQPPELAAFIEGDALAVWPLGEDAETLRLARLHEARDAIRAEPEPSRDYGEGLALYRKHLDEVRELTPESSLVRALETEIGELEAGRDALHDRFVAIFESGVYESDFLATFVSNFPDAAESPSVALALGEVYSRVGRPADAIDCFLRALGEAPAGGDLATKAQSGLRALARSSSDLAALQQLADQGEDPELAGLAAQRLDDRTGNFTELAEGASYLEAFPVGERAGVVRERLNDLAENRYGEVVLYQTVGDDAKAVQGIQEILRHAPLSPAAERLRSQVVLEG
ncbi:MAG: M48 family metalloprotease [Thermoanaerobaculia bacterium]